MRISILVCYQIPERTWVGNMVIQGLSQIDHEAYLTIIKHIQKELYVRDGESVVIVNLINLGEEKE